MASLGNPRANTCMKLDFSGKALFISCGTGPGHPWFLLIGYN